MCRCESCLVVQKGPPFAVIRGILRHPSTTDRRADMIGKLLYCEESP